MGRSSAAVVEGAPWPAAWPATTVAAAEAGLDGIAGCDDERSARSKRNEAAAARSAASPSQLPLGLVRHLPIIGLDGRPSRNMHLRVTLRFPGGEAVTYDTHEGRWAEPWGTDEMIAPGLWALPGLVDGHAHLAQATMDLAPGISKVRTPGRRWRSMPVWG